MNSTVFFDIGDTLASPVLGGSPPRLTGLEVYPYVPGVLAQLAAGGVPLGLISNIGPVTPENVAAVTQALADAQLASFFPETLRIYGRKDSPDIFLRAAAAAGHADHPERCVFTGEDSSERSFALQAGMRVCPHPLLVSAVLQGEALRFVRITVPEENAGMDWRGQVLALGVVPAHVTGAESNTIYAVATASAAAQLDDLGFLVDRLGAEGDPLATELFLFRDDQQQSSGFLDPTGHSTAFFAQEASKEVLASTREGLIVAVPGGRPVDSYHFADAQHGHTEKLVLDVSLLAPAEAPAGFAEEVGLLMAGAAPLGPAEVEALNRIDGTLIRGFLDRYAGAAPLDGDGSAPLSSRHIFHDDNRLAVDALARDLEAIGGDSFRVRRRQFSHQGRTLHNVEAELAGAGSTEVVLVTAHLDSTARSSGVPYDPALDPAPGADDDASGVAAVLAIASAIRSLAPSHPPKRAIRFVLFNAEEDGLVGSKAYARDEAFGGTRIVGVFQMDMVGFHAAGPEPGSFEVHVGFPSQQVVDRSLVLAEALRALAPTLAPNLAPPQIFRNADDPAAGRSDHASFHERGFAACVCSEDFFAGPAPDSPAPQPNPNYHKNTDTVVNVDYAADIARLVAGAVLATANA